MQSVRSLARRTLMAVVIAGLLLIPLAACSVTAQGLRNCPDITGKQSNHVGCYELVWVDGVQYRMTFSNTSFSGNSPQDLAPFYVLAPQTDTPQGAPPNTFPHDHVVPAVPSHNGGSYTTHYQGFFVLCSADGISNGACVPSRTDVGGGTVLPLAKSVNGQPLTSTAAIESAAAAGLVTLVNLGPTARIIGTLSGRASGSSGSTDLAISNTDGVTTAVPGTDTSYTITAVNNGPNSVSGASVSDTFPAPSFSSDTYTAAGAGGASGFTASGSGNIADSVTLPDGASITYTVTAHVNPSATGSLANTASVAMPAGRTDPVPGNNSATDTDTLTPQIDIAVSVDDGVASIPSGGGTTWPIRVTNNGPSTATNVQLTVAYTVCNGGCAEISHSIISPLGTIAPGVTVSGGSTGVAGANAEHQVLASVLTHIGYGGAETDTNPANNIAEDTDAVI